MLWWTRRQLKSRNVGRRTSAIEKLASAGEAALIASMLGDADPGVRLAAANALAELGDPSSLDALTAAAESDDGAVRAAAIRGLSRIRPTQDSPPTSDPFEAPPSTADPGPGSVAGAPVHDERELLKMTESPDAWVRLAAADGLRGVSAESAPAASAALRNLLSDTDARVRRMAAVALDSSGWTPLDPAEVLPFAVAREEWWEAASAGADAIPFLETAVVSDALPRHSRATAARALASIDDPLVIASLVRLLADPHDETRTIAQSALDTRHAKWATSKEAREAVPALVAALDSDWHETRIRACAVLAKVRDPRAVPPLVARLHDAQFAHATDTFPVRDAASAALVRFGVAAVGSLIGEFRKGTVNEAVASTLIKLGGSARRSSAAFVRAACEAPQLTQAAVEALVQIGVVDARLFDPFFRGIFAAPRRLVPSRESERLRRTLEHLIPSSALTSQVLDAAIDAAGFEYDAIWSGSTRRFVQRLDVSDAAVDRLCADPHPAVTNILHLVATKPDVRVELDGGESLTLSFHDHRERASAALAARGNPPYTVEAYVRSELRRVAAMTVSAPR